MFAPQSASTGIARHRGGLAWKFSHFDDYGGEDMKELEFFAGVDWGRSFHEACVTDADGEVLGQRRFDHGGEGLAEMARWMLSAAGVDAARIGVSIETPRGPVVATLVAQGFAVYSINPKQLDRYRDRFTMAGSKDDRLDARVLAETVRLDRGRLRPVAPQAHESERLRGCSRLYAELTAEKTRLVNQLRGVLWEYYPQFLKLSDDPGRSWVLQLWRLAPTPERGRRIRKGTVEKLLKKNRIRSVTADAVKAHLSTQAVAAAPGAVESAVFQISSIIERLELVNRQLKNCTGELDRLIGAYDESLKDSEDIADQGRQRDVEILTSIPGVGRVVLATLLAEASDMLHERDYNALRTFGGVAPVTRRSGKSLLVHRRLSANGPLRNALYHWARTAVQHDPVSRAKYERLRAAGHGHARSLRSVADRLLKVACTMLHNQETFKHGIVEYQKAA